MENKNLVTKNVSLEEAKEILENEKVFYNGTDKLNIVDVGKYNTGWTYIVSREWVNRGKELICPMEHEYNKDLVKKYIRGMNYDFDATNCSVVFGSYRISQTGKPVFEVKMPTEAEHVLVISRWGGAFESSRGVSKLDDTTGIIKFVKRSSNGGGCGRDYHVMNVGFVHKFEDRDVSEILKEIEDAFVSKVSSIYEEYVKEETYRNGYIQFKKTFLKEGNEILKKFVDTHSDVFSEYCIDDLYSGIGADVYITLIDGSVTWFGDFDFNEKGIANLKDKLLNIEGYLETKKEVMKFINNIYDFEKDDLKIHLKWHLSDVFIESEYAHVKRMTINSGFDYPALVEHFENLKKRKEELMNKRF